MPPPPLRSPVSRAVVPVVAGAAFIALLLGVLWIAALILSRNADDFDVRLGDDVFKVGRVDDVADEIEDRGPLLFPGLIGPAGRRPVGLNHDGVNDFQGWQVFSLRPRGAPASCLVSLDQETRTLTDCDGNPVVAADLPVPDDVLLVIEADSGRLTLDLRSATTTTAA